MRIGVSRKIADSITLLDYPQDAEVAKVTGVRYFNTKENTGYLKYLVLPCEKYARKEKRGAHAMECVLTQFS